MSDTREAAAPSELAKCYAAGQGDAVDDHCAGLKLANPSEHNWGQADEVTEHYVQYWAGYVDSTQLLEGTHIDLTGEGL